MAEKITASSPWKQSAGSRSAEGKAKASRNAWMGRNRELLRELSRLLAGQRTLPKG